jgi:hypothetical protein
MKLEEHIASEVRESLEYLYRTITSIDRTDGYAIKQLALELRKLLTDRKEINGKRLSLFDVAFDCPQFPVIYTIQDRVSSAYEDDKNHYIELGVSESSILELMTFGTSLSKANGIYKPVLKVGEFQSLSEWLKSQILVLSNEGNGNCYITIENVIKDIGNKEAAHIDVEFVGKPNQRYTLLERLEERYEIVLGLIEVVLAVYESTVKKIRFKIHRTTEDQKESRLEYRDYNNNDPLLLEHFFTFNGPEGFPGMSISYSLLRLIEKDEEVHLFSFGDDFSLKVNDEHYLYIDNKGDKIVLSKVKM